MASTPQRVTRSMSSQPRSTPTSAGPPIQLGDISSHSSTALAVDAAHPSNPYQVDLVIPFDISLGSTERTVAQQDIREGYERLLHALEGEGGLRVATKAGRGGKGKEELWIFVGAGDDKIAELVERERLLDRSHNLPPHKEPPTPSPATRIRLLYNLLTAPPLQHGLGLTPGEGKWKRVKSVVALHDEEADAAWVKRWTLGGDWRIGLLKDPSDEGASGLGDHQPPPVHLYFSFLNTYTISLVPLSIISVFTYLFTPSDSYPPFYALILSLYSTIFVALWRIRERKLAVRWGTRGCESVAVGRLRPEYVANLGLDHQGAGKGEQAVDAIRAGDDLKRDVKLALSVPVIIASGFGLGVVLMGIFVLEAFVAQIYEGVGKQVVPLVPTALFSLVVPQIVAAYNAVAKSLVKWEDHPTPVGAEKSLTAKTFAMNGIVAYLGLFLSAYVYVPFGPFIMAHVQSLMAKHGGENVEVHASAEKAGLGPATSGEKQRGIKAGRLKGQLFAYTVTNQVVNTFFELGLPYILRFVNEWRAGKTTIKAAVKRNNHKEGPPKDDADIEKRFMDKVERELALPDYSLFTDYAEMVTQFGYVTIWSIVWPLAPVFALINNYIELRTDALKICKHVRRPIGDRVETIGSWLDTLGIISWLGAVTNATLIYLFRPSTTLHAQTPNPNVPSYPGSAHLAHIIEAYDLSPALSTILPTFVPLLALALAASHAFIVLRWAVEAIAERVLWRGSPEEMEVQKILARNTQSTANELEVLAEKKYDTNGLRGGFWNGGEEGAREIGRVGKAE
ncbi:calcium-activated chloride channel-domain-containing protein [Naematelia encephala]|uniref:Calcium-activated chloride channel-domain-containing protein n=1 Tax=Naematelia encephala TaxID=71784 RepID=A0A1Y2AVK1_9TREE|nr:calcium-activated chloride channel-domain-containing protein [Naematelia encephala]